MGGCMVRERALSIKTTQHLASQITDVQHSQETAPAQRHPKDTESDSEPGCLAKPGFAVSGAGDGRHCRSFCTVRETVKRRREETRRWKNYRGRHRERESSAHESAVFAEQVQHSAMSSACATDETEIVLSETINRDEGGYVDEESDKQRAPRCQSLTMMVAIEARRAAKKNDNPAGNRRQKRFKIPKRTEIPSTPPKMRDEEIANRAFFFSTHAGRQAGFGIPPLSNPSSSQRAPYQHSLLARPLTAKTVDRLGRFPRDQHRNAQEQVPHDQKEKGRYKRHKRTGKTSGDPR